ncbi:hypothetical protein AAFF_G00099950 [Aldrovandia affinis]|uniref:Uncharacterized protein n=1 Tax=Aldrovandia affinis TaxID=143900 RepID=A0AAD7RV57_9TELE|nr:hypothetical protein AAFF_G00099950 [Aldrovandia affinis]
MTLAKDLRTLCASGGFTLTKWTSHNRKVLMSIPEEQRAKETKNLDLSSEALPVERALGIQWDTETDAFTYSIKLPDKPMTRRGILAVVNSIYDPLGLLAPVILPAKLLLKDLCKEQSGWDEDISEKHAEDWKGWTEDVTYLSNFQVNRCLKPADFGTHCFSAVAPLLGCLRVTIPRLELTAAVVAVKIDKMLHQELQVPLQPSTFWTDSTTVLRYIDNDTARFKTFVANRINVIREATKPSQWKYVRTTENPADLPSRGLKAKSLAQSRTWIDGPSFLLNNECDWPSNPCKGRKAFKTTLRSRTRRQSTQSKSKRTKNQ